MKKVNKIIIGVLVVLTAVVVIYKSKDSNKIEIFRGKLVDYQIGHFDNNDKAIVEVKFVDNLDIFGKYLLSRLSIDSKNEFHCIIPILQINDNKGTIWSLLWPKYYLDFPIVLFSTEGDTINSLVTMELTKKDNNLYLPIQLPLRRFISEKVPICDLKFVKSCMIKKN